jgi:nicotinamidase-related amidase
VIYTTVLWRDAGDLPLGLRTTDPRWNVDWRNNGSPAEGRWGAEIATEIAPADGDTVLAKPGFICSGLADAVTEAGADTVYLTGTTANNCVYAAALTLFEANLEVFAISDCISGFGDPMKQPWLQNISMFLGHVTTLTEYERKLASLQV